MIMKFTKFAAKKQPMMKIDTNTIPRFLFRLVKNSLDISPHSPTSHLNARQIPPTPTSLPHITHVSLQV